MNNSDNKGMEYELLIRRVFGMSERSYKFGADADIFDNESREGYKYIVATHIKNAVYQLLDDDGIGNESREKLSILLVDINDCKLRSDFVNVIAKIRSIG